MTKPDLLYVFNMDYWRQTVYTAFAYSIDYYYWNNRINTINSIGNHKSN